MKKSTQRLSINFKGMMVEACYPWFEQIAVWRVYTRNWVYRDTQLQVERRLGFLYPKYDVEEFK